MSISAQRLLYTIMFIWWCYTIGECEIKVEADTIFNGPRVGTILAESGYGFIGEFKDYTGFTKDENLSYRILAPRMTSFHRPFYFSIIKEIPRPDSITVEEAKKYYEYYEILYSGHSCMDICFCGANAISYIDIDDSNTYLITTILSPKVITDTLLCINSPNWLTPGFNYKLSLADSILAIGRIVSRLPEVEIIKIEGNNQQVPLYTISNGLNVSMSYDYRQFLIDRMVIDTSLKGKLKSEIMIYDIPSDLWVTLSSVDYFYSKPRRISHDDYLYYKKGRDESIAIWRTKDGISEELVYDPGNGEYVYDYSLSISKWLRMDILKSGEEADFKNLKYKSIHLSKLKP